MERKLLPYLVVISALSVSLSAAFYSVFGLSKMFAGASLQVIIMASSLEIAKLVAASLLYQYWSKLTSLLKVYLSIAVIVLMAITSGGIYGFLSSAYSETSNKLQAVDKNVNVLMLKRDRFQTQLDDVITEKRSLTANIKELSKGLANNVIQYTDTAGNIITTTSRATRRALEAQLSETSSRRSELYVLESSLTDSVTKLDLAILSLETDSDIASEIGPLKFIADLTGNTIDQVVNWFICALMLVFDPLAVALVISANIAFASTINRPVEEFDEEDALDQVLNTMVEEIEETKPVSDDIYKRIDNIENWIQAGLTKDKYGRTRFTDIQDFDYGDKDTRN